MSIDASPLYHAIAAVALQYAVGLGFGMWVSVCTWYHSFDSS